MVGPTGVLIRDFARAKQMRSPNEAVSEDRVALDEVESDQEDMEQDDDTRNNAHLSGDDYRIIVARMEIEENVRATHGSGGETTIGGKPKIKKLDAFGALTKQ